MKKLKLTFGLLTFFMLWTSISNAQVRYKIDYIEETQNYQVSLVAYKTWTAPHNITASGQVTIKVPTGEFELYDLQNLQQDAVWIVNSTHHSPDEAREFDYISFGLSTTGTKALQYEDGTEVPLFTFKNTGICGGEVTLINNLRDPFLPPNSRDANIGNQLTVLGARGDAYAGNVGGSATCVPLNSNFSPENVTSSTTSSPKSKNK